jgi:uncharacterized damage-inducible protein DinB
MAALLTRNGMDLMDHFNRLLEYDVWANREVLASLKGLGEPPANCVRLLAHVIAAEHLWFARLTGMDPAVAVWPDLSLDQCTEQVRELYLAYRGYFQRQLPAGVDRSVTYKNSKGEEWSSRVEDILTHVFMHSTYHRGQIAMQMRQTGYAPAYTDFIHGVRQGLVR